MGPHAAPRDPLARLADAAAAQLFAGAARGDASGELASSVRALEALGARAGAAGALLAAAQRAVETPSPAHAMQLAAAALTVEQVRAPHAAPAGELAAVPPVRVHSVPHKHVPPYGDPEFAAADGELPPWVLCEDTEAVLALADLLHTPQLPQPGIERLGQWSHTTVAHDARILPLWVAALVETHSGSGYAHQPLRHASPARVLSLLRRMYDPAAPGMSGVLRELLRRVPRDERAGLLVEALQRGEPGLVATAVGSLADYAPGLIAPYARAQLAATIAGGIRHYGSPFATVLYAASHVASDELADVALDALAALPARSYETTAARHYLKSAGAGVFRPRVRRALDALLDARAAGPLAAPDEARAEELVEMLLEVHPPAGEDLERATRAFEAVTVDRHRVALAKRLFEHMTDHAVRALEASLDGAPPALFVFAAEALARSHPAAAFERLSPAVFEGTLLRDQNEHAVQSLAAVATAAGEPHSVVPDPRWFEPLTRRLQAGLRAPAAKHARAVVSACAAQIPIGSSEGGAADDERTALLRAACVPGSSRWNALVVLARKGGWRAADCIVDLFEFRGTALREKLTKTLLEGAVAQAADAFRCAAVDRDRDLPFDETKLDRLRAVVPA